MKLVIAEKPSVALEISKVIGASEKKNGYYEGNNYFVTWCVGHLVENAMPEDYSIEYKKWSLDTLPIIPEEWKTKVATKTKEQFKVVKELANRSEVEDLICATDSAREGELIFRLVYNQSKCKKPFKRLWISSMTEEAIKKGFEELKNGAEYDNLYKSAFCRSKADWIVGLNVTRLYTCLYNRKLIVGRVQSPTINLVVERDKEIESFIPKQYFILKAKNDLFEATKRVDDSIEVCKLLSSLQGKTGVIESVEKNEEEKSPSTIFDLTSLQRAANKLLGYSAQQTLDLAQSLYEKKLLTYPRTDGKYLSSDMKEDTMKLIDFIVSSKFLSDSLKEKIDMKKIDINKVINDKKISDHHGIIPTKEISKEINITESEKKILQLVIYRLLEATYSNVKSSITEIELKIEEHIFNYKGKQILDKGYLIFIEELKRLLNINKEEKEEKVIEQDIIVGMKFENIEIESIAKKTIPPKHYTEATLLAAMENIGRQVEEKLLKDSLSKGLGTPATRASTIENIISNGFIKRDGKKILSTNEGRELMSILPLEIKSPILTAEWEEKLNKIEMGSKSEEEFLSEINMYISNVIDNAKRKINKEFIKSNEKEIIGVCPRCKKNVYEGKSNFYCEGERECGFALWKEDKFFINAKKKITKTIAKKLLEQGKVEIKGLYSVKKDKEFDATIVLEDTGKYINFKYEF